MSSTNRGGDRSKYDFYITPLGAIEKFLYHFSKYVNLEGLRVLDPSAGGDANHFMPYPKALRPYRCIIDTIDIREDSKATLKADYLQTELDYKPDMIITNPPFDQIMAFIEKALDDVKPGGYVVMLCRLNFFGSQYRKPFWDKNMPLYTFVDNKRMSFTPDGKTDSIEYGHFVWKKGLNPEFTKLKVI